MKIKLNKTAIKSVLNNAELALYETGDALKTDLQESGTMPFDLGYLQDDSMFVKKGKNKVSISSDAVYARRLYFHPEYNFDDTENPHAGAEWWKPYITGDKKEVPRRLYIKFLKGKLR